MAAPEEVDEDQIKDVDMICPPEARGCGWRGKGRECSVRKGDPDRLIRCPRCGFTVEREGVDPEAGG